VPYGIILAISYLFLLVNWDLPTFHFTIRELILSTVIVAMGLA